ncbi:PLP-dependent aminotransferase family protein [Halalkalibacterium halodurans]|jgi:2-aminoadipate transaminase|uniref:aminotransferase-like domain-containing protein n=1 Tax=Halalkalibacterium halodurans TaxID=86665 RepID=UPI002E1A9981|nr:PLP-dependent aminotransferase family protein [Halalkalibacterium halodurans]MED4085401.1 PLP-dependent aminotransferase family protein [Halalkalibacterium halodurans]MED4104475.1 PLP-dependent aminotransferase family protein [Halalkalibacterium halodurans]MED4108152.1 PLP-dependent aminotransferase family protein [Halalkalibacterium halodurans]MED4124344.1 PLP-dependent aminotransferase family protein [Halalkalibacterium halodurans]
MKYAFAKRVRHLHSSAVRDILKVVNQQGVISFAGGLPDDELFPLEAMEDAFSRVFATGKKSMQYSETEGFLPLRELILERMGRKGIRSYSERNVLITTGSQQAIDLFSRVMFNPGDVVLTEDPTYLAALQVFESYEAEIVPVASDDEGMIPEDLEQKMKQHKPKCVYVVPTFSNPAGRVWSLERRKHLLNMAHKHHVLIFEDDPYGDIQFNQEETYVPLAAMDTGSHVLYTSTFSKTAVPALRTGWITGPFQVVRMMAQAKQANDLHSNSLSQQALYQLFTHHDMDGHIQRLIEVYRLRKDVMIKTLQGADIPGLRFVEPKGGMFLWAELDEAINTSLLIKEAVAKGMAYVPGEPFYAGVPKYNTLRLNFTHSTPEKIEKGIGIFADVVHKEMESVAMYT